MILKSGLSDVSVYLILLLIATPLIAGRIETLDKQLRNFENASRELGSSIGIVWSSFRPQERLAKILFLFHESAACLHPRTITRKPQEVLLSSNVRNGTGQENRRGQTHFQAGDNNNLFDYTYVGNIAQAHLLAANKLVDPTSSDNASADSVSADATLVNSTLRATLHELRHPSPAHLASDASPPPKPVHSVHTLPLFPTPPRQKQPSTHPTTPPNSRTPSFATGSTDSPTTSSTSRRRTRSKSPVKPFKSPTASRSTFVILCASSGSRSIRRQRLPHTRSPSPSIRHRQRESHRAIL
ncbi:hypothetical protein JVT61DRAFT_12394 [Boletus reticuloceps]|uniref:3-beta hydroxysteroid dehydrogenase/isomerase domain-containing protein n=1 Tax=Boletus reticuloceps TaxID=495285 RepID=A0A8I3A366_9AGAM|nr:hypothetical protein JVT61DRAFT_12394 [Boletus reticuloceps]